MLSDVRSATLTAKIEPDNILQEYCLVGELISLGETEEIFGVVKKL